MTFSHRFLTFAAITSIGGLTLTGCTTDDRATDAATSAPIAADAAVPAVWDSTDLHTIEIDYEESDYEALISAYLNSGEKVWISATVTIDGEEFDNVGLKLKGNSSLRGLSEDADASISSDHPEDLPWIIRLDKYVDEQAMDGATEFVVRGNSSETSLNEAVALDLLSQAGLATEKAISVSFTAGDSEPSLRLVVENPNDAWMERELGDGLLWKSESDGTWDYIDDDPDSYKDAFDQEGGENDYEPLVAFLQFINESEDGTFSEDLGQWLDVDSFATYLAFQNVINNFDDIDGPGNNSYLYWDTDTAKMTVVNWDLNLAFGQQNAGGMGGPPGSELPDGADSPDGIDPQAMPSFDPDNLPEGMDRRKGAGPEDFADGGKGEGAGSGMGGNILAERFLADDEFEALYDAAVEELTQSLFASGAAQDSLDTWSSMLTSEASDLVDPDVVSSEAADLTTEFPS